PLCCRICDGHGWLPELQQSVWNQAPLCLPGRVEFNGCGKLCNISVCGTPKSVNATLEHMPGLPAKLPEVRMVGKGKRLRESGNWLAELFDMPLLNRPQHAGGVPQILDAVRVEAHEAGTGGIDGRQVCPHDNKVRGLWRSHDRSVPLHPDDSVDDRQMWPDG